MTSPNNSFSEDTGSRPRRCVPTLEGRLLSGGDHSALAACSSLSLSLSLSSIDQGTSTQAMWHGGALCVRPPTHPYDCSRSPGATSGNMFDIYWRHLLSARRGFSRSGGGGFGPARRAAARRLLRRVALPVPVPMPVPVPVPVPVARSASGLRSLDDCTQDVILGVETRHPALDHGRTLLLDTNAHVNKSGAQQLTLELRDSWGACDSCALRLSRRELLGQGVFL
jgi:hypothetical protein